MSVGPGKLCSQCGLPIPDSELGNRCPNCLLELAITPLPDEPPQDLPVQRTFLKSRFFADYEILEEIARGGMGVVYRARQLSLNRLVALKVVQSGLLASPDALLRFQVEVRAVALLNHPNIISLHEAGEHEGQHYFSMGLVEGSSLADLNARCALRNLEWLRRAVGLLVKVARAVHHAHQHGILHRDLKPSNILLDKAGEPHVADFGLAKVLEADTGLTRSESVVGSPNYMAPEQASGRSHEVTTAVDIYSLGAILYELVTGGPPFQSRSALETMRLVIEKEPISPRKLNLKIDANLETICLKCLRKEPQARYSSAAELAQDLESWLQGRPIRARPVGAFGGLWLWSRRHPAVSFLSLALVLALVGIAVGSSIAAVRVSRAERRANANLRESLLNQTRTLRLTSLIGNRALSLNQIRQASALGGSPNFRRQLRDELLATLARTDLNFVPQPQLPSSPVPALNLLAPRFDRWATVTNARTVRIVTVPDGREVQHFDAGESPVQSLESFSDDGRYLGLRQAGGVSVWDINTGRCCFATNDPACVFCFTSGSTGLVVQVERKVAVVLELPLMNELRRLEPYANADRSPAASWIFMACSPNGRTLAAQGWSTRLTGLIDLQAGKSRRYVTNLGVGRTMSWSADGVHLAVANHRHRVSVWNANSDSRAFESSAFPAEAQTVAMDASASLVAVGFEDRTLRLFDVEATRLACEFPCVTHRLAFDPRGTRIGPVFCNGAAGWLQLERSTEFLETAVTDT
ncbi:MAG: serine/threonine-protein kinase, partial [Acidobacteriales bacterium]|nr:serine/threonine-protein kinase [Terriglobales bacterium]